MEPRQDTPTTLNMGPILVTNLKEQTHTMSEHLHNTGNKKTHGNNKEDNREGTGSTDNITPTAGNKTNNRHPQDLREETTPEVEAEEEGREPLLYLQATPSIQAPI